MTVLTVDAKLDSNLRQAHFIDIDNLTSGPCNDLETHRIIKERYVEETNYKDEDLCFVACAHPAAFCVSLVWSEARVFWRSGKNGADRILVSSLHNLNATEVDHLFVASGDGCFISCISEIFSQWTPKSSFQVSILASFLGDVNGEYFNLVEDVRSLYPGTRDCQYKAMV